MLYTKSGKKISLWIILLLCIWLILSGCASKQVWRKSDNSQLSDLLKLPGIDAYSEAGAILLLDEGRMEIFGGTGTGFGILERHSIVKICNTRGQKYANIVIPYSDQSKVVNIQARTISPEGKEIFLRDEDVYDVTFYPNFIFYSDHRAKLFTVPGVEDGSVIEYRYNIEIYSRTLWHGWTFQADEPILVSRFSLAVPSSWPVNYKCYGLEEEPSIQKNPQGFKDTYIWEVKNNPPLKTEMGMPPKKKMTKRLAIAPVGFDSWENVITWYSKLAEPQMKAGDGVKELVDELTETIEDPREKLKRIYDWVRDRIRYIAVEVGIGGYKPHPAEEVLQNRYGDCKDMTTLLCSMIREAGIEANQVLISTWQNGIPDTTLPSPLPFNHVIVHCPEVDEDDLWLDATAKGCPFGQLPWYIQGLPVLIAGSGETGIQKTPEVIADSNRTLSSWNITMSGSGVASIEGETSFWGSSAAQLRDELLYTSPVEQREWMLSYLARRCSGADLDSLQVTGVQSFTDPVRLDYTFQTTDFVRMHPGQISFQPWTASKFELPDLFRSPERTHPIRFRYGAREIFECHLNIPEGFSTTKPSFADSLMSPYGQGKWSWSNQNRWFYGKRDLTLKGKDIQPEEYKSFQQFLDNVRTCDKKDIILIKE